MISFAAISTLALVVGASDVIEGTMPTISIGAGAGLFFRPYEDVQFDDVWGEQTYEGSELSVGFGLEADLRLDSGSNWMIYGQGLLMHQDGLLTGLRGGLLYGWRLHSELSTLSIHTSPVGLDGTYTETKTTTWYGGTSIPLVVGGYLGGGFLSVPEGVLEPLGTRQEIALKGGVLPTIEVGGGMIGQYVVTALLFVSPTTGATGLRGDLAVGYDFGPIGAHVGLDWYLTLANAIESPVSSMVLATLSFGDGMGVADKL